MSLNELLRTPPVAFIAVFLCCIVASRVLSLLAFRTNKGQAKGTCTTYACGEEVPKEMANPDYSQFFPFAFFFTLAHVAALMLATTPAETFKILAMALLYTGAVVVGLCILLRR